MDSQQRIEYVARFAGCGGQRRAKAAKWFKGPRRSEGPFDSGIMTMYVVEDLGAHLPPHSTWPTRGQCQTAPRGNKLCVCDVLEKTMRCHQSKGPCLQPGRAQIINCARKRDMQNSCCLLPNLLTALRPPATTAIEPERISKLASLRRPPYLSLHVCTS